MEFRRVLFRSSPSSNPAELPQACDVDRDAQSCLKQAIRLYEGKTLPKDDATARRFAAKACAEGAAEGCNFLAAMLEKGIGGPADRQAAVRNYRRACNAGYANACYNLGQLFYFAAANEGEVVERSEEHTSELQSLMRISYAVFCLIKKKNKKQ